MIQAAVLHSVVPCVALLYATSFSGRVTFMNLKMVSN